MVSEDIIPITYAQGTGGVFLCHFIVSAKRNLKDLLSLTEHGNAYPAGLVDISGPHEKHLTEISRIDFLIEEHKNAVFEKPLYTRAHLYDINLVNKYFSKSIRIIYNLDDINEIASAFHGKVCIDEIERVANKLSKKIILLGLTGRVNKFSYHENMPNILFISWRELLYENTDLLISKISNFTNIDVNNFSKESIAYWREKTLYCIDKFKNI